MSADALSKIYHDLKDPGFKNIVVQLLLSNFAIISNEQQNMAPLQSEISYNMARRTTFYSETWNEAGKTAQFNLL